MSSGSQQTLGEVQAEQAQFAEVADGVVDARAWDPMQDREYPDRCCQNCGTPLPESFRRCLGDENDVVDACINCTDKSKLPYYGPGIETSLDRTTSGGGH